MVLKNNTFKIQLFITCVTYFLLHIPFLFHGYGVEEDSWGLVVNAKEMFEANSYVASRLPGHPVHEYILLWLYPFTPFKYNVFSALAASIAVFISALLFKKLNVSMPLLAALALGFCPVFFIAGTYTIDYTISLMLLLFSWYLLTENKIYLAAIVLSLSIGARITNAAMLLPMIFYIGFNKENRIEIIKLTVVTVLLSVLLFVPAMSKYGMAFFDYTDQFPYPNLPKFMYKATLGVFGLIGCVALLLIFIKKYRTDNKVPLYVYVSIAITILAYIKLPQKSAYLIPIIPFLIILFSIRLNKRAFTIFCISFIISGWVFGINLIDKSRGSETKSSSSTVIAGQEIAFTPFTGNIIGDYTKREIKNKYVQNILVKTDTINKPTAIISGWWYNQLLIESLNHAKNLNVKFVFYCDSDSIQKMKNNNLDIYYLEEQDIYNDLLFNMQKTKLVAESF